MTRSVLITGASSGIGEGLAREFARRGWRLALLARRLERLEAVRTELLALGSPEIVVQALDVRDTASIAPALTACWGHLGGIDVVIANAGVGHDFRTGEGEIELIREIVEVDLTGACATIDAAIGLFRRRGGGGHVVGITSVARYRGLPRLGVYSACKEGLHRYLQAVRMEVEREAITVTELAPGYIDTPMNRDVRSRPFVIDVERGARIMADLVERQVSYATVPQWPWRVLGRVMQVLPAWALRAMI